jgi:plastocyanin
MKRQLLGAVLLAVGGCNAGQSAAQHSSDAKLPHSVSIVGNELKHWTPSSAIVHRGAVEVSVGSSGKTHNFVLAGVAGGRSNPLFPGQTVHLHVTLHPGTYRFTCTYHPTMTGTLVVR